MFSSAVNVVDYVMEDYMVLANYVQGFENKTVMASNSPLLEKYPSFGIDYGTVSGSGRIVYALTDHEPLPTEEATIPVETAEATSEAEVSFVENEPVPFPVIPLLVSFTSLALIICMLVFLRKKQKNAKE